MAFSKRVAGNSHSSTTPVLMILTGTVEADYSNRAAFPGLRADKAARRSGKTSFFFLSVSFAKEVWEDAENMMEELGGGRGLFQAYRSLAAHLRREIDDAEGVQPDPGVEGFLLDVRTVGCLPVGTKVQDSEGEEVIISAPHLFRRCRAEDGPYRDKGDGHRFAYRPGYCGTVIRDGNPESFFYSAGELQTLSGDVTHLRLACVDGKHVAPAQRRRG